MNIPKENLATVFSFDLKFTGSRRTAFYRKLFGSSVKVSRVTRGSQKNYTVQMHGLLARIPHIKLGRSVIAVPMEAAPLLKSFFSDPRWAPIELHVFTAVLPAHLRLEAMERALGQPVKILKNETSKLSDEIVSVQKLSEGGKVSPGLKERAEKAARLCEALLSADWSDGQEFSAKLKGQLEKLKKIS